MSGYKINTKVRVTKGRHKGETGRVRGESNLNMEHMVAIWRDKPNIRKTLMWFSGRWIEEVK